MALRFDSVRRPKLFASQRIFHSLYYVSLYAVHSKKLSRNMKASTFVRPLVNQAAFRRLFTTTVPRLAKPQKSKSASTRRSSHPPHASPSRTGGMPHSPRPTSHGAPLHPPAPRSVSSRGSNLAAAGPTGFVTTNIVASSASWPSPGSWWSAQSKSSRAILVALGLSGYLITTWVVYLVLSEKQERGHSKPIADKAKELSVQSTMASVVNKDGRGKASHLPDPTVSTVRQADHKHVFDDLASSYD